jgi:ABC-type glycerol-3-phosphate transport system substrate-binding protein
LGVAKSTKQPQLAWEFVKLLATPRVQQLILANRAGMPVLKSLANDPALSSGGPPANMQAFVKGIDFGVFPRVYPTACGNFYTGVVQSAISDSFHQVLNGAKAEDVFKAADAQIQACLDAANQ